MSTEPTNEEPRIQAEAAQTTTIEAAYFRWLGHPVLLNYAHGSGTVTDETLYEVVAGPIEGREALFLLEEAGPVGVVVRKLMAGEDGREELGTPVFIPWGTIHSMVSLDVADEEAESESDGE